jgi:hypothetical protein
LHHCLGTGAGSQRSFNCHAEENATYERDTPAAPLHDLPCCPLRLSTGRDFPQLSQRPSCIRESTLFGVARRRRHASSGTLCDWGPILRHLPGKTHFIDVAHRAFKRSFQVLGRGETLYTASVRHEEKLTFAFTALYDGPRSATIQRCTQLGRRCFLAILKSLFKGQQPGCVYRWR